MSCGENNNLTNVVEVLNNQLISLERTSNYNAAYLITNPGKDNIRTDIIMANVNVPTLSATATISSNYGDMTKFDYQYDTVGRISQIDETSAGVTTTKSYQYNQEGKLAAETRDGVTTTWGYDANGNRISENGVNLATYDSQDRLIDYANKHYQYNQLGQLTQKTDDTGTTTYNYDVSGNLTQVQTANGDIIDYSIDPLNRRVGRKVNGLLTNKYLYLGQLNPVAELYADDKIKSLFIYAGKSNVPSAMESYDENGTLTGKYRIISNHLGSVVKVIDVNTDEVVQAIDYDVWGNVLSDSNPSFQPFYFAGGIYDQATQLTRFGARDYDAETGHWTAKDPIGFGGGLISLYDYVGGDPVNHIDPSGKQTPIENFDEFDPLEGTENRALEPYVRPSPLSYTPPRWVQNYIEQQVQDKFAITAEEIRTDKENQAILDAIGNASDQIIDQKNITDLVDKIKKDQKRFREKQEQLFEPQECPVEK